MPDPTLLSGRYRLGTQLGGGGMADVFAAVDERLGRDVAIKLFRGAGDERHRSEVQVLAALNHPNLVQIYDAELGDPAYVVMELVGGRSLDVLLRDGVAVDVARVGRDVADGLAYAHARGVVHRDVKPGNIIAADDGRTKLADFGIARLVDQAHLTATGQLMGTAAYLAPEQARGEAITGAADVYALGLVLLECVTGRREYDGPATEAAIARLTRPPTVPADAPHAGLLQAMTETDPARRPSAAQVSARLRGAEPPTAPLAAAPVRPPTPTQVLPTVVEPTAYPERRSPWGWITAVLVLLAAAIAAVVVYAVHTGGSGTPATSLTTTNTSSTSTPSDTTSTSTSTTPPTSSATSAAPTTSAPTTGASPTTSQPPTSPAAPTTASSPGVSISLPGSSAQS